MKRLQPRAVLGLAMRQSLEIALPLVLESMRAIGDGGQARHPVGMAGYAYREGGLTTITPIAQGSILTSALPTCVPAHGRVCTHTATDDGSSRWSPTPMWETWAELLFLAWASSSSHCCECLGRAQECGDSLGLCQRNDMTNRVCH